MTAPAKKPDLDKLARCAKDALTKAGVYRDDGQVVGMVCAKHFAGGRLDGSVAGIPRLVVAAAPASLGLLELLTVTGQQAMVDPPADAWPAAELPLFAEAAHG